MLQKGMTFDDFLVQLKSIEKMGGFASIISSLPGGDKIMSKAGGQIDEGVTKRTEAIIMSMTKDERAKPSIINGSRRARIAKGAGVEVYDVNTLIKQFDQMNKMMSKMRAEMGKSMGKGKKGRGKRGLSSLLGGLGDLGGLASQAEMQRMMRDMMSK